MLFYILYRLMFLSIRSQAGLFALPYATLLRWHKGVQKTRSGGARNGLLFGGDRMTVRLGLREVDERDMYRKFVGPLDATELIHEFYALQAVEALRVCEEFRHSHEKWLYDFESYKQTYDSKLASLIFDYTARTVFGEVRYAGIKSSHSLIGFPCEGGSRPSCYVKSVKYEPLMIFKCGMLAFSIKTKWIEGYGGSAWHDIAETGYNRAVGKPGWTCDPVFIDRCVDLSHNSSPYFDKVETDLICLWSKFSYQNYLDFKRLASPVAILTKSNMSQYLTCLVHRGVNIGILSKEVILKPMTPNALNQYRHLNSPSEARFPVHESIIQSLLHYEPQVWGKETIKAELQKEDLYECPECGEMYFSIQSAQDCCDNGCQPSHYECEVCGCEHGNEDDAYYCCHYVCEGCGSVYVDEDVADSCCHSECSKCGDIHWSEVDAGDCCAEYKCCVCGATYESTQDATDCCDTDCCNDDSEAGAGKFKNYVIQEAVKKSEKKKTPKIVKYPQKQKKEGEKNVSELFKQYGLQTGDDKRG